MATTSSLAGRLIRLGVIAVIVVIAVLGPALEASATPAHAPRTAHLTYQPAAVVDPEPPVEPNWAPVHQQDFDGGGGNPYNGPSDVDDGKEILIIVGLFLAVAVGYYVVRSSRKP